MGNNYIKLQQLSPTTYPKKDRTFDVKVQIDSPAPDGHVNFKLSDVQSWEGHAMNAGTELDSEPDLTLTADQQTSQDGIDWGATPAEPGVQKIGARWAGDAPTKFTVQVKVHDYGAYGTLKAQLHYDGGEPEAPVSIHLPRDDNGNKIADGWHNDGSHVDDSTTPNVDEADQWAASDNETGPAGNRYHGDGFSVFEEYRGFMIGSGHVRTDPAKKDIFIYSAWKEGVGDLIVNNEQNLPEQNIPSIFIIHEISQDNMGQGTYDFRRMDYKGEDISGGAATSQKALWVKKDTEVGLPGRVGVANGPNPKFVKWTPYKITMIKVYEKRIKQFVNQSLNRPVDTPNPPAATVKEVVDSTIAHEIGHGIGLGHDLHIPVESYYGFCIMEAGISYTTGQGPDVPHRFLPHHYDGADPTDGSGFGPGMYKLTLANEEEEEEED